MTAREVTDEQRLVCPCGKPKFNADEMRQWQRACWRGEIVYAKDAPAWSLALCWSEPCVPGPLALTRTALTLGGDS